MLRLKENWGLAASFLFFSLEVLSRLKEENKKEFVLVHMRSESLQASICP